jgi:hypothetical protein
MAKELLTYCAVKGSRIWEQDGNQWRVAYSSSPKAACGRLVRVTTIKAGDVRNMQSLAVIRVRGNTIGVHPKDLKLVGRG